MTFTEATAYSRRNQARVSHKGFGENRWVMLDRHGKLQHNFFLSDDDLLKLARSLSPDFFELNTGYAGNEKAKAWIERVVLDKNVEDKEKDVLDRWF